MIDQLCVLGEATPSMIVWAGATVIPVRPDGSFLLELRKDCALWGLVVGVWSRGSRCPLPPNGGALRKQV